MGRMFHLYVRDNMEPLWEKFRKLCEKEGKSVASKIFELIREYVERHLEELDAPKEEPKENIIQEVSVEREMERSCVNCIYCELQENKVLDRIYRVPYCKKKKEIVKPKEAKECEFYEQRPEGESF